jgi:hypothetical protein
LTCQRAYTQKYLRTQTVGWSTRKHFRSYFGLDTDGNVLYHFENFLLHNYWTKINEEVFSGVMLIRTRQISPSVHHKPKFSVNSVYSRWRRLLNSNLLVLLAFYSLFLAKKRKYFRPFQLRMLINSAFLISYSSLIYLIKYFYMLRNSIFVGMRGNASHLAVE